MGEVIVDKRERSIVSDILKEMGVEVKHKQLSIGDYILPGEIIIERKTVKDFISSILDRRLFKQARNLLRYKTPMFVVEGEEDIFSITNVHPNAIRGAIISLLLDYKIPIVNTRNESETAFVIYTILQRIKKNKKEIILRDLQKPKDNDQVKEYVVSALPGVGLVLARRILDRFKTLEKVFSLTEKDLLEVEGIGKEKAKKIISLMKDEYSKRHKEKA